MIEDMLSGAFLNEFLRGRTVLELLTNSQLKSYNWNLRCALFNTARFSRAFAKW